MVTDGDAALLVLAPQATRSGSTRVLVDLLDQAGPLLGVPVAVRVLVPGPMSEELVRGREEQPGDPPPRAVLGNTVLAAAQLLDVRAGTPTAIYVHESPQVLVTLDRRARAGLVAADLVLCVSTAVAEGVIDLGVDPAAVELLPPIVPPRPRPDPAAIAAARVDLGAAATDRLVLACGEARPAKGADLFVEVVRHLADDADLRFGWVGRRGRAHARHLDHDLAVLGLDDRVCWRGEVDDVLPYLAAAEVLVVPSRDDSQPLVPLEAAGVDTPTAAFAVGGLATLGVEGAALVVPYPDTASLAGGARSLLADPGRGRRLVARAAARSERHHHPDVVAGRFVDAIHRLCGGG